MVDSFIPTKRNKKALRFSFCKVSKFLGHKRAISGLNGFKFFGNRIEVNLERFKVRSSY